MKVLTPERPLRVKTIAEVLTPTLQKWDQNNS